MNKDGTLNDLDIHANVFFAYAPIKIYPTYYLWVKKSLDGGETWNDGEIINTQIGASGFTGFSPGRGIAVEKDGKTRVIFTIYDNNARAEFTSAIYTDDGGKTWQRGSKANKVGLAGKSSESQLVLMNNGVLGMVRQWQTLFFGKRYSNTVLERQTDFVALAKAFGANGVKAETPVEFKRAFVEAVKADKPTVIDVRIDKDEFVLPMLPPGGSIDDMITMIK
jgi:hypothetical protein